MDKLRVAFFTEAGSTRGMGHLVRTYTLYKKALSLNLTADFYLDSNINYNYSFANLIPFSFEDFKIEKEYDIIFIDSYIAPLEIYNTIANNCKVPVYIDDYARLDYPQGVIINFAPDAKKLFFQTEKEKHIYLLGLPYLLLREEIIKASGKKKNQIFIMLGGSDTQGLSLKIIQSLQSLHIHKVIVCNDKATLQILQNYKNTTILYKPEDKTLINSMAESNLAITTASMSVYELAYLKTPCIIISVAKNQNIGIKQYLKHKLAVCFVDITKDQWKTKMLQSTQKFLNTRVSINQEITQNASYKIFNKVIQLCKKY